jgi:hypothetical protein
MVKVLSCITVVTFGPALKLGRRRSIVLIVVALLAIIILVKIVVEYAWSAGRAGTGWPEKVQNIKNCFYTNQGFV